MPSAVQGCSLTKPNIVPVYMDSGALKCMLLPCSKAPEPGSPARAAHAGVARHPLSGVHFHSPKVSAAHGGLTWNRLAHHVQAIPRRELIFPNKYAGETLLLGSLPL